MLIDEEFKSLHYRTLDDVIGELRAGQKAKLGCTLLIGAGCSKSAGIPLASEFVSLIKEEYPRFYANAREKTYSMCMAELPEIHRQRLFAKYVDAATINEAHLCIASLVKAGYVDRVLTTNFDQLIVQACALLGEFPAVYDFAASQLLKPKYIPSKAVFHLHGQRTGFVLLNTPEELKAHAKLLGPLMEDSMNGRMWIIVGYSGATDGVFEHIASVGSRENNLYWVGYESNPPPDYVTERLLAKNKALYVDTYNADTFFSRLTSELGIHPPDLVSRPFSHLDETLEKLKGTGDLIRTTRQWVRTAVTQFEKPNSITLLTGFSHALLPFDSTHNEIVKDFQELVAYLEIPGRESTAIQADRLSRTYIKLGDLLVKHASVKTGDEADQLYESAFDKYQAALARRPTSYEAYNNWGVALSRQAKSKTGPESTALFREGVAKFMGALEVNPRAYEPHNNWGALLYEQAFRATGPEKSTLLTESVVKYQEANKNQHRAFEVLNNLGCAFLELARSRLPDELDLATDDLKDAISLFEEALVIKPGQLEVLNNLGAVYLEITKFNGTSDRIDDQTVNEEEANYLDDLVTLDPLGSDLRRIFILAESVRFGAGSYITACRYSILGIEPDCKQELRKSLQYKQLPSKEYMIRDPNLDNVKNSEWFQQLIGV
jgi:tetratricopeptide (TPR) repeat protein/NAD-dependent SIR2 family protein deacetylase